ncbi:NAD-dependent succinate-semialdehyde dehydrogenase [Corynebacterium sp. 153RC1]|uniref:NAD-dependent succinate-semialdehyde dehydrogenase n=1 Tax=unclassified Corynebacterium TaxID=2624378 RepID=UPI00211C7E51|nr:MULTISPECIES: NAD-dependent succinate-semialdehyde dehydrogenase [unclassified Corynebacterium]MCQ9370005.1 NAD-dependent succinate-semialdehyde dehydrogenase [Corynebacterium sp. 35RC1]MCQ9352152.1 NAD-dependent succinate-semialdehyde dehydrogenase [Corynebacterium sp. 209RC1]MCQ9354155.1 NAD-dependent succinate-semialdehyde dehydrogenase [Corynebacterium sp. 1222RC1]MCQ9356435.1 NAD-dependent succinate-semialdehyde dehydrogenase [Corynebacterium sp. 122RC1]MCQ9358537.1 NAD-dependent succi
MNAPQGAPDIKALPGKVPTGLLIGGEWVESASGDTFDVLNPATEEVLATLASADADDALRALSAAADVQDEWARTAPRERAEILRAGFEAIVEHRDEFATLMTLEMGKPLAESDAEVTYGAEYLRWFSEETVRHYGRVSSTPEGTLRMITRYKPVGPCLLITPWNFPLSMATRKIAPALAAGCTMVVKPAKLTPLTTQYFAKIMLEAGLPAGVLNVVSGKSASAISEPIMADSRLRKMSFTGSTAVGRVLLESAAQNILRTSMELGGNAPLIVCEDANIEEAVAGAVAAKMRNGGQACTSANRIFVHEEVAQEFTEKFVAEIAAFKVGNGLDQGVRMGPLIEPAAVEKMEEFVRDATRKGAHVATGGARIEGKGYFFAPTVLTGVTPQMRVFQEEIFGPIAPVLTYRSEEEVLRLANTTEYGLASYVFTENVDRLWRMADGLEFGMMGFNAGVISNAAAPFGGVKQSGLGREGSAEGINEYTSVQYLGLRDPYSQRR